jgi:hypothetical protein
VKKIPTLFVRDPEDRAHVLDQVNPGCEWVLNGEGTATEKWDGTCVMLDFSDDWWARREVKPGKNPPAGWIEEDRDEITGKRVGWEPIEQSSFAKFHTEALERFDGTFHPATYELVGPKINGNRHRLLNHQIIRHGEDVVYAPRTFDDLRDCLVDREHRTRSEGVVWWHPDGRRAKLKAKDFAAERKAAS